jgi:hypothetical protein
MATRVFPAITVHKEMATMVIVMIRIVTAEGAISILG